MVRSVESSAQLFQAVKWC